MLRRKLKKAYAWLLAVSLITGTLQFSAAEAKAAEGNLALSANVTASDTEDGNAAQNMCDGSKDTRWASNKGDNTITLNLTWDSPQTMKSISILWERRTVQDLEIEVSPDGNNWENVFSRTDQYASALDEIIIFDEAKSGKQLRLTMSDILATDPDNITANWASASIIEMEIYKDAIPDIGKIVSDLTAPEVNAGQDKIFMPAAEGASVRFCADYEQIIGEDGTVYQPLTTKTVKGFYEIKDVKRDASLKTEEFTVTVPGKYTNASGSNEKPAVIPELQEWYGEMGDFIARSSSRIVVGSSELSAVAEMFAEDYKDITGAETVVVSGDWADTKMGDFYMGLTEEKGLGKEGYTLSIGNFVNIAAEDPVGAYWATRSVLQILKQTNGSIPKGLVRDYPKYEVRAFSLDVGRKPFTMDALYQFAKNMSWYKMNSFQVHLSDNLIFMEDYKNQQTGTEAEKLAKGLQAAKDEAYAGFRLESGVENTGETYPELKGKTATSKDLYYTKDEFRKFIKDSRAMGIDIVPEFDMPAHALAFTRAFPEYRSKSETGGSHAYTIDEMDLSNPETTEFAKSIWQDYFTGEDPVFDEDTIIHIGTDEYHGTNSANQEDIQRGKEEFRQFSDDMIKFVQETGRTVRMWGSLSNKGGTTPVTSEGVQLNIWSTGYADPANMYHQGFDLINTLVNGSTAYGGLYIVPDGSRNRGAYGDLLQTENLYNNWQPNIFSGYNIPAGDDQMLGACYAAWHDNIDTRSGGISQYDTFYRFMDSLQVISAKVWGDVDKEKTPFAAFQELAAQMGTAPNTNMYAEVDFATNTAADWTFDDTLEKDSGANEFDLTAIENAEQVNSESGKKALRLRGGSSYAETPLNQVGSNAVVTMKVKMDDDASAESEQILCESKDEFGAYGTYAIKASVTKNGKSYVGFSREGYDYTFNYTLPKNEWVELSFCSGQDTVALYVNGTLVDDNPTLYEANHPEVSRGAAAVSTMMVPIGRIGSSTDSFQGEIEYVTLTGSKEAAGEEVSLQKLQEEIDKYADAVSNTYTDISWNIFLKAREEAKKTAGYENSTVQDYTYAYEKLLSAADDLVQKPEGYDQAVSDAEQFARDLNEVMQVVDACLENTDAYTEETVAGLKKAVSDIKEIILQNPNATSEELSAALKALRNIKIVSKEDVKREEVKGSIKEAIAAAENALANTAGYTKESVDALQKAVTDAKAAIENENISLSELNGILSNLNSLKLEKDTSGDEDLNPKDGDTFTVKGVKYTIISASEKTVRLTKGKDVRTVKINTVPNNNVKYTVVEIANNAYKGCKKKLKSVTIGAGVTKIGKNAFKGCSKLTKVIISNKSKLKNVGTGAFKGTSKKISIKLPRNLKKNKGLKNKMKKAGIKKGL